MFWRFGGYANISTLDTILDKPDVTLEELLDESDLIQELKQHNTKLIEYLRDDNVLRRLLEYVVAPAIGITEEDETEEPLPLVKRSTFSPVRSLSLGRSKEAKEQSKRLEEREAQEKAEKARQKYAFVACEVLSSETWSIIEALMENQQLLRHFWEFLRQEPPLDPITASYFTKINETLIDKKTEEMLEFVKSLDGIVSAMLQHVDCPMVMDLLLKIISMEKVDGGQGIVDWLQTQNLMPLLLEYLGKDHPTFTQTSAGDFIKAIITISANASQNEQSCIGPNSLTRQLVSETCIESLTTDMLRGGNPLTVGVGIIIEVIRKNNSDYDPDVGAGQDLPPSSSDPIYLGTLLRLFAKHVPDFTALILSPNHTITNGDSTMTVKRKELKVAFNSSIEPLGFDRFKTCELMAELLHCSNMGLLNERGSEAFVRQRDQERERLKAEGALSRTREPQSAATEFSEDSTGYQNGGSPTMIAASSLDDARKLEVANSAEEDGFEDVGASGDLADEIKDDFDEKSPFELETNLAQSKTPKRPLRRLDLDEEFVDEPLTSPRLEAVDERALELHASPEQIHEPERMSSPRSPALRTTIPALTSGLQDLNVHEEADTKDQQLSTSSEKLPTDQLIDTIKAHIQPESQTTSSEAPPLPHRDRTLAVDIVAAESGSPQGLSPHADDKPAPLFSSRSEGSGQNDGAVERPTEQIAATGGSQDTIDTTLGEEGDSSRSIIVPEDQTFAPHIENDVDGQPIVGDYLKMMFVQHEVVPTILDFFFRFPWNNFLHNVVYDVVQQVFNGPMDRGYNRNLAIDLFQTGQITERIMAGQERSDEAVRTSNMRLGYMGHLTLIAEEVIKFGERHPVELLSSAVLDKLSDRLWTDYCDGALGETRERDAAILGGVRPDTALGPRQAVLNAVNAAHGFGNGASNALANAGLNGAAGLDSMDLSNNGSSSSSAFGLSGNSLLSGFGNSSDEEDEEMEEMAEHDEGHEGSADQYPTYAPSSLSALSIFSPPTTPDTPDTPIPPLLASTAGAASSTPSSTPSIPPPLAIAPSRARRQLAARLALHGKVSPFNSPQASPNNDATAGGPGSIDAIVASSSNTTKASTSGSTPNEGYDEDEDGEDVPITIAVSPTKATATGPTDAASNAKAVAGPDDEDDSSDDSSDDEIGSDDDEDELATAAGRGRRGRAQVRRRVGVRAARVRSLIEDEDDDVLERAGRGL